MFCSTRCEGQPRIESQSDLHECAQSILPGFGRTCIQKVTTPALSMKCILLHSVSRSDRKSEETTAEYLGFKSDSN